MVAAGRPSLAGRLAFVFSFGGHANFQRVVRYLCSGIEPPAPGIDNPPRVPPPHDYGVAIVALDLAEQLVPADQVEPLKTGILRFLHASHLALFDQKKAERGVRARRARWRRRSPNRAGRSCTWSTSGTWPRSGRSCCPYVANLGDDPALSPDRSPAPDAPVFLLHGAEDNVVPALETLRLGRHLEARTRVHVLLTPLISHAEVDRPASTGDVVNLVRFWAGMF